eukprot:TRINITY_DN7687_c0_g1_i2.p2 TRINITY_DN7687_c0_g1~~TRINITY_DN7687_c0_g1_i2.p2  ORF type:complete len:151 (-),score=68.28 TRINITY_DN7687_c0_g1_i2:31-483(-)
MTPVERCEFQLRKIEENLEKILVDIEQVVAKFFADETLEVKRTQYALAKIEEDFMQQLLLCDDIDVPDEEWRQKRREMIKTIQSHQQELDRKKKEVNTVIQKRQEAVAEARDEEARDEEEPLNEEEAVEEARDEEPLDEEARDEKARDEE